jgi:hypothetical protein
MGHACGTYPLHAQKRTKLWVLSLSLSTARLCSRPAKGPATLSKGKSHDVTDMAKLCPKAPSVA